MSTDGLPLPVRAALAGATPYGAPVLDVPVRLNVNENPYPPSPGFVADVADAVRGVAAGLNRYPDRDAIELREALAGYLGHGLAADRVWAGNGSNEVMLHVLQAFGGEGRAALSFTPTYSMYPEYARATGTRWVEVPRAADFSLDLAAARAAIEREQPAVVFLATPNNPTGTDASLGVVEAVCDLARRSIVVVDEAYAEFREPGTPSALRLLDRLPNLVVTRTMSKAFAFAGARVGSLAASAAIVDVLRVVRLPYHLSAVTQAVARVALAHADETLASVARLRDERNSLAAWLQSHDHEVAPSAANFVLVQGLADPRAVWTALVDRGVLVRETSIAGALRVSIGTADEMAIFRGAWLSATATAGTSTAQEANR